MRVLVVNAGSSNLKVSVLDEAELHGARELSGPGSRIDQEQVATAVRELGPTDAVGHRIVHGAERYLEAVRVTDDTLPRLRDR